MRKEKLFKRFRFEYFAINAGSKLLKAQVSLKKPQQISKKGTAYKIYGCGYLMPKNETG